MPNPDELPNAPIPDAPVEPLPDWLKELIEKTEREREKIPA